MIDVTEKYNWAAKDSQRQSYVPKEKNPIKMKDENENMPTTWFKVSSYLMVANSPPPEV